MANLADDPVFDGRNWLKCVTYVSNRQDTYPYIDPTKSDLTGKSVLVTGASKGIGKAAAVRFAMAGCSKILLAARSDMSNVEVAVKEAAKATNKPEPLVCSIKLDITSEDSVKAAAETAKEVLGGSLDILINNAGNLEEWKPIIESNPKDWWWTWEVTVKGTYLSSRYFIPLVLNSTVKTVINVSSGGSQMVTPGASAYQASKMALCRISEFIDMEHRQQGVISISIHPGGVKTELAMNLPEALHPHLTDSPELPADTIVWLCSERREWLSGRFVNVQWDMEELVTKKEEILKGDLFKFRMAI